MTSLDDALNESSTSFGPHPLTATWREWDNLDVATNPDSVSNLGKQSDGTLVIQHSLDDGLPDSVTMTSGNDASGNLTAGLVGREGLTLATRGTRTFDAASWSSAILATTVTGTIPTAAQRGDYLVCCLIIDDSTSALTQVNPDPSLNWDLLGYVADGNIGMFIFGMRHYAPGRPPLTMISTLPVDYICLTTAFWALNPQGMPLDHRVTDVEMLGETVSGTGHAISSQLGNKGTQISFFGADPASGVWTPANTLIGSPSIVSLRLTAAITGLIDSGSYSSSATSANATALAAMAAVSVEPYERPRMTAAQYFSPFNSGSPIYGYDRDTAGVSSSIRVITATGPVDTPVFSGQMQAIDGVGQMSAVSRTRIRMNRSVSIPIVGAFREGLTMDWFATWLMSRGSQFVGPAPSRYTRFWAPLHGSTHAHYDTPLGYNAALYATPEFPLNVYGQKYPTWVQGPFNLAMFAQQTATRTDIISLNPKDFWNNTDSPFPHITDQGGPLNNDFFSQTNSKGRLCFWIRADPAVSAPSYLNSGDDYLFQMTYWVLDRYGAFLGFVRCLLDTANRRASIQMGSDAHGYSTVIYTPAGALPTDGSWRSIGFYWDFASGAARVVHNGTESSSTAWATAGNNGVDQLALNDKTGRMRGDQYSIQIKSHLPIAEVMLDTGQTYAAGFWNDQYPIGSLTKPGETVTMRPTGIGMSALCETNTFNVWDTVSELAQNSLSAYRVNESDGLEFLPLSYFGETAQMTPVAVQDTRKNTADIPVTVDPSRSRNSVTVQFNDTRVDTTIQKVLLWNTVTNIPPGTSVFQFSLDTPIVELHGASTSVPASGNYVIANLTSAQIITPQLPTDRHFVTVLTKEDGTGVVLSEVQVSAEFVTWDSQSVTIKFTNRTGRAVFLSNNENGEVPFMQILGYGVHVADAYSSISDSASIQFRGERGLDAELDWVQDRDAASILASNLLGILSNPRAEVTLRVMGDPRRKPGQMITVLDADETNVSGTWRVMSVTHTADGPAFVQDITAVQVLPASVWDGLDGWDEGVWS